MAMMQAAPNYRFYALPDGKRPGLIQWENDGAAIACEVWEMRAAHFGSFVAGITAPHGIGKLELADAQDITDYGGWRASLTERGK
jgi:allophanate hydrolase